jgi:hypothetical protein
MGKLALSILIYATMSLVACMEQTQTTFAPVNDQAFQDSIAPFLSSAQASSSQGTPHSEFGSSQENTPDSTQTTPAKDSSQTSACYVPTKDACYPNISSTNCQIYSGITQLNCLPMPLYICLHASDTVHIYSKTCSQNDFAPLH